MLKHKQSKNIQQQLRLLVTEKETAKTNHNKQKKQNYCCEMWNLCLNGINAECAKYFSLKIEHPKTRS